MQNVYLVYTLNCHTLFGTAIIPVQRSVICLIWGVVFVHELVLEGKVRGPKMGGHFRPHMMINATYDRRYVCAAVALFRVSKTKQTKKTYCCTTSGDKFLISNVKY